MTRLALLGAVLAGCASAGSGLDDVDAPPGTDGAPGDMAPPIDQPVQCTPQMADLLMNGSFDGAPLATGWTETRIAGELIIRNDSPIGAHSPSGVAWLGGVPETNATDAADQTITVPASTTALVLTGQYQVRTSETTANLDTAKIGVQDTAGAAFIGPTHDMTNSTVAMAWTPINLVLPAAMLAGQSVRVRLTSTSGNATGPTSFYVDSLALTATFCPP